MTESPLAKIQRITPSHWQWLPLKRIATINSEVLTEDTDPNFTFRYIEGTSVQPDGSFDELRELRLVTAPTRARRIVRGGDVIVATVRPYLRTVAQIPHKDGPLIASTGFIALRASELVFPRYLYWWTRSDPFAAELVARSVGVGYPAVSPAEVAALPAPVPPAADQAAIGAFLDTETARIDALVKRRKALIELLWSRWESEVHRTVTRGLDPLSQIVSSGLGWAGDIPSHWSIPPIYANFDVQLGKMLNPERAGGPNRAPYVRNVSIQWDRVDLSDLATMSFDDEDRRRFALRPGDLLVCEGGEAGRAAIWPADVEECYYQKAVHRVRSKGQGNLRFLMYCLWAAASMSVFAIEGNQATIVHLTAEKLRVHRFPFPPPAEQEEIVSYLDTRQQLVRSLLERIERQVTRLGKRRQALITAAVTGQIKVEEEAT